MIREVKFAKKPTKSVKPLALILIRPVKKRR